MPRKADATRATPKKDWADAFLAAFEAQHLVKAACAAVGIDRSTAYRRREKDEAFAARWEEIEENSTDLLEREAYRRAAVGVDKPVFYKGEQTATVREYSDTLLIFLLKSRRPERYREHHRVEHTGPGGAPLDVNVRLDQKQRKALSDVLRGRPATRGD